MPLHGVVSDTSRNISMNHRYEVLKSLVNLSKPINEIKNLLRELDWDFEGKAFVLEKNI